MGFYYDSGMVRLTGQEKTHIQITSLRRTVLRRRAHMKLRGAAWEALGLVGMQQEKGEAVVYMRTSRLGWASLNNFGGAQGCP